MSHNDAANRPASHKLVLALFLIVGICLIVRTMAVQTANQAGVAFPVALWPDDGQQIILRNALATDQIDWAARQPDRVMTILQAANQADPLYPWPFLVAGLAAQQKGDTAGAEAGFMAAKVRDPRYFGARYYLIQHHLAQNNLQAAMDEIIPTARLRRDERLVQALLALSQTPRGTKILLDGLDDEPYVRDRLLEAASYSDDHVALLTILMASDAVDKTLKFKVISNLAAQQKYSEARNLWSIADPDVKKDANIFDNGFNGRSAPPPFGWALTQDSYVTAMWSENTGGGVAAEKAKNGGLDVEFYGARNVEAANQIIFLQPGDYMLSATGQAVAPKAGAGAMLWTLSCAGKTDNLGQIKFLAAIGGQQRRATKVTIPATDCAQQRLALIGDASTSATSYRIRFSTITIAAN